MESSAQLEKVSILSSGDKGISAGENSSILIKTQF